MVLLVMRKQAVKNGAVEKPSLHNVVRAERGLAGLRALAALYGDEEGDLPTALADFLSDVMHFNAQGGGINVTQALRIAQGHYQAERGPREGILSDMQVRQVHDLSLGFWKSLPAFGKAELRRTAREILNAQEAK